MEKQKKVLNVIKGYMSKFDIEQVTIIEDDKDSVIFPEMLRNSCIRAKRCRMRHTESK